MYYQTDRPFAILVFIVCAVLIRLIPIVFPIDKE